MPSELLKLVKWCGVLAQFFLTLTILPSQLDFLILVLTMPQHLKRFFKDEVAKDLFVNDWDKSGICNRSQLNGSESNPIFSSFAILLKSTAFQSFDLIFPSELWNNSKIVYR
jgi:hypothetical protein